MSMCESRVFSGFCVHCYRWDLSVRVVMALALPRFEQVHRVYSLYGKLVFRETFILDLVLFGSSQADSCRLQLAEL